MKKLISIIIVLTLIFGLSLSSSADLSKMNLSLRRLVTSQTLSSVERDKTISILKNTVEIYERTGEEPIVGIIVRTSNPEELKSIPGVKVGSVIGDIATAYLPISALEPVSNLSSVKHISASVLHKPYLDKSIPETKANQVWSSSPSYKGAGVLVCIYDTGIDWTHADFKDASGKSRILYILDQTKTPYNPPGVEWSKSQIDAGSCNEVDTNGHGTHVAGTVAGDGSSSTSGYIGMAPEADILAVRGGIDGFTSAKEIDGVNWAMNKATTLGKPVVINMSLGGHVGPHDGTSDQEVAIDNASGAGKIVVIAAGNEGDEAIHAGGSLGTSLSRTINIPSYSGTGAYLLVDCWYPSSTTTSVTLQTPSGTFGPVAFNNELNQGNVYIWHGNGRNGTGGSATTDKEIYIEISEPGSGNFTLTFSGGSGTLDAWITSNVGAVFTSGDFTKHVAIPGTCKRAITVGSYVTRWCWPSKDYPSYPNAYCYSGHSPSDPVGVISSFSNPGPSRDGRQKPEITAPGQAIMATRSKDASFYSYDIAPDDVHVRMQGTSMATPHVCGGIALMLQKNPTLTPEDIKTIFQNTAKKDSYTGTTPNDTWGYGKMDILAAVNAIGGGGETTETLLYDDGGVEIYYAEDSGDGDAVRFTPSQYPAIIKEIKYFVYSTGSFDGKIWNDGGGSPGAVMQSFTVSPTTSQTWYTRDVSSYNLKVNSGDFYAGYIFNYVGTPPNYIGFDTTYGGGANRSWWYTSGEWVSYSSLDMPDYDVCVRATVSYPITGVSEELRPSGQIPMSFSLSQNYPNPFNPETVIRYGIRDTGYEMQVSSVKHQVSLKVYSITGQLIRTLVNEEQNAGYYSVKWNGRDDNGISVPSGIYIYKLDVGNFSQSRRMVLMK